MGLAHNIAVGCRLLGSSVLHGPRYANPFRAAWLRFAASNFGKRMTSAKETTLRVAGWKQPLRLRSAGSDFSVLRTIIEEGEYADVLNWKLPPKPRILDLGGNIGITVRYLIEKWPDAQVLTVEPDSDNLRLLEANCKHLIDSGQVRAVRGFVAAQSGTAGISRTTDAWGFTKVAASESEQIPCHTVPQLLEMAGWDRVDLLKCDIEGSEQELFDAPQNWLDRVDRIVIELHVPYLLPQFYEALNRAGWNHRIVTDSARLPNPLSLVERSESR